jgi:hypothetical protein
MSDKAERVRVFKCVVEGCSREFNTSQFGSSDEQFASYHRHLDAHMIVAAISDLTDAIADSDLDRDDDSDEP